MRECISMLSDLSTLIGYNDVTLVGQEETKNYNSKENKVWDHFVTTHSSLV